MLLSQLLDQLALDLRGLQTCQEVQPRDLRVKEDRVFVLDRNFIESDLGAHILGDLVLICISYGQPLCELLELRGLCKECFNKRRLTTLCALECYS